MQKSISKEWHLYVFLFILSGAAMGTQEQPCYTLIQSPTDTEQPSEMQLKQDLGNTCIPLL